MGVKKYNPATPATRFAASLTYDELTKKRPEKSLTTYFHRTGGRNSYGRITSAGISGGHKKLYREIDFLYSKKGIKGSVQSLEYDPNRSANIALVLYEDGDKRYIIAPMELKVGAIVQCGPDAKIEVGNSTALKNIPLGTMVYCVEMEVGCGARIARSAGNYAILAAKDGGNAHLKLPSGEVRLVNEECYASVGQVGNAEHENVLLGKAGRTRYLGRRPKSRAVAKNPIDHPMGGGEGKSSGGRHPCTPWGEITKGLKTRKTKKSSTRKIIKRRK